MSSYEPLQLSRAAELIGEAILLICEHYRHPDCVADSATLQLLDELTDALHIGHACLDAMARNLRLQYLHLSDSLHGGEC